MNEPARTIVVLAVLVVGTVTPFVLGAFSEELARPITRPRAGPMGSTDETSAVDGATYVLKRGEIYPYTPAEVPFLLNYSRTLTRARISRKPVLLYFTSLLDSQPRTFENRVLHLPAVVARLRQFECAGIEMAMVPHPDPSEAKRLLKQNEKLRDELVEQGWARGPVMVVVPSDFELAPGAAQKIIAKARPWDIRDEESVIRFLDGAIMKASEPKRRRGISWKRLSI